ncbi:FecR domain-containing protein [Marispirochaeta aestuarii]|uniref:FecR domain-containing protein n=1 Tax=Marispirochaeta aestuarii TaxID=1963862 RepID=UPI002ABE60DD|nr:FecR domain-containing protein [Marispirochaeta aestuarii]
MKRVLLPFSLILVLLLAGCSKREPESQASTTPAPASTVVSQELPPVETPALDEGIIAYISGEVDIADESGWFPAEIGDLISPSDRIRTAADSSCEIQFGRIAVISLQENTEIDISRINLTPESSKVGIAMAAGTVLSKVQKLSGADSFSVRTQSAVCGVRGTEFSVTTDASGQSVFAVREGSVAILPPDMDTEELKKQLTGQEAEAEALIDQLLETAPRVEANQEMALGPDFAEETREAAESVKQSITQIAAAESPEERKEKTRVLAAATMETSRILRTGSAAPAEISPEKSEVLKQTDKMRILEIPVAATKDDSPELSKTRLSKVAVKADPADASILLNGESAGKGSYSALFEEGSSLTFTLQRDGYTDYEFSISVSSDSARLYNVKLASLSSQAPTPPAAPQAPPASSAPEPQTEAAPEAQSVPARAGEPQPRVETVPPAAVAAAPAPPAPESPPPAPGAASPRTEVPRQPAPQPQPVSQSEPTARIEAEIPAQPEPPSEPRPAPAGPGTVRISLTASPADALVQLDRGISGTGRASFEAMPGDRLSVTVSRRGFTEERINLEVGDSPASRHIVLQAQPVLFSSSASQTNLIGLTASDGLLLASDARGTLSAVDLDGKILWRTESSNRPNENNLPVVAGNRLVFSGSRELLIADLLTGKVLQRIPLESRRSHLFGRRALPYQEKILYPANNSLDFLDPATGSFSSFADLGTAGSRMSPGIYRDMILIADQEGSFLMIGADGRLETSVPTGALQPLAQAVSVHDDRAVFSGRRGDVVCLDLQKRVVIWEKSLGDTGVAIATDIAVGDSGIYPYGMDGTIYGLDLDDGTELFTPIRGAATPPLILDEGRQFVYGTRDRKLIIAAADTGTTSKSLDLPEQASTRPVIIPGDSLIALGTREGHVLLIEPAGIR